MYNIRCAEKKQREKSTFINIVYSSAAQHLVHNSRMQQVRDDMHLKRLPHLPNSRDVYCGLEVRCLYT